MNIKFSLLYFSYAFVAQHGGRLHSEAFLKNVQKAPNVKRITAFPEPQLQEDFAPAANSKLRKLVKRSSFLQVLFFYRRNNSSFKAILPVIKSRNPECLHMRVDSNFLIIPRLRKHFPDLLITTEINASPFDENLKNIAISKFFRRLERKSLEKADANFFVSDFLKNRIMGKNVDETRDYVAHNGVDRKIFRPAPTETKTKESNITIGYVGTIDYHKKVKVLVDAFSEVYKHHKGRVELLIIGDGPDFQRLQDYVHEKELQHAINFKGRVEHSEILEHLYQMDIAVHHSAKPYMSPLKLFEYMAVGLPVVGPDTPGVKEIFEDNKDLLLVKAQAQDICNKILYLIENEDKRNSIADSGRRKVHEQYGWEENVNKILSVIGEKYRAKQNQHIAQGKLDPPLL